MIQSFRPPNSPTWKFLGNSTWAQHLLRGCDHTIDARIREDLLVKAATLEGKVSQAFITNALTGLDHWVRAGEAGCLAWGVLHFRKPA